MTRRARVAVVGRPNVGKSTLVNRLAASRRAITGEAPHLTRDLVDIEVDWAGRSFTLHDTGGLVESALRRTGSGRIDDVVAAKAMRAVEDADLALFVVDVQSGATADDLALAERLARVSTPVIVVANKADDGNLDLRAAELWTLGLGEPSPVSALHGRSSGELLDRILSSLPVELDSGLVEPVASVAIVGRPNVGKSSLFNRIAREERAIVHEDPGTTRDAIDTLVTLGERTFRFIDTAGIRRHARTRGVQVFGAHRTRDAIARADVALQVIDASEGITNQDQRIAREVEESGTGAILAMNKWDLLMGAEEADRMRRDALDLLRFVSYAPVVRTSAKTGRGVDGLLARLEEVLVARAKRLPTAELNRLVADAQERVPPPGRDRRHAKILYATQTGVDPPSFVLFVSAAPADSWLKYLERRLREQHGFAGTPLVFRVRERSPPA